MYVKPLNSGWYTADSVSCYFYYFSRYVNIALNKVTNSPDSLLVLRVSFASAGCPAVLKNTGGQGMVLIGVRVSSPCGKGQR